MRKKSPPVVVAAGVVLMLSPFAAFWAWDRIEAARVVERLERIETEPVDVEGLLPGTDEQKQASHLYAEAMRLLPPESEGSMLEMGTTIEALAQLPAGAAARDPRLDKVAAFEQQYERVLDLLQQASRLDARGYLPEDRPKYSTDGWRLARLNAVRIARRSLAGDTEGAADALLATLRIRRMYPPALRHATLATWHSAQLVLSSALPEATLLQLQREYEAVEPDLDVEGRVRSERSAFALMFSADALGQVPAGTNYRRPEPFEALAYRFTRPVRRRALVTALDGYEEALAVSRAAWPAKLDAAHALLRSKGATRQVRRRPMLQRIAVPWSPHVGPLVLANAVDMSAIALARARAAAAAIAVLRYQRAHDGTLPPALDALVPAYLAAVPQDPFTGAPLRYLPRASEYIVYSVGGNRRDDGGDAAVPSDLAPRRGNPRDLGLTVSHTR